MNNLYQKCSNPLFLEEVKIAALFPIPQRLRPGKAQLFQPAIGHVIHITKQPTQRRAAGVHAGRVPEALGNGGLKVVLVVGLRALPQVRRAHDPEKDLAIQKVKARNRFQLRRGRMFFRRNDILHILPHAHLDVLPRQSLLRECLIQRNAGQDGLDQRLSLMFGLICYALDQSC